MQPTVQNSASPAPPTGQPPASITDRVLARLSRVTSGGRFVPEIDGLRFVAIGSVLLLHMGTHLKRLLGLRMEGHQAADTAVDWLDAITKRGGVGVSVFFAISGCILSMPFAAHSLTGTRRPRLRDYFLRRVTRLEPPYIVTMIGFFVANIVLLHASARELFPHLGASLLYSHNWIYKIPSAINGVAWSLEVEVQFYILAPLLAAGFALASAGLRRALLVAAIIAWTVLRQVFDAEIVGSRLDLSLLTCLPWFLVGFLFTDIYIGSWRQNPPRGSWMWDALGLLGLGAIFLFGAKDGAMEWLGSVLGTDGRGLAPRLVQSLLPIAGTFALFLAVFRGRLLNVCFTNRWITTIGGMCYSIYLLHYALIAFILPVTLRLPAPGAFWAKYLAQGAIVIPIVLVVSAVFFALIERPCMIKDWPQRLWRRVTGAPADVQRGTRSTTTGM